jgi:outer membrane protein assembly factor BamB
MMFVNTLSIIIALLTWSPNDNNDRYQREPLPVPVVTTKTEFKQLWYTKTSDPVVMSPTIYEHYVYVATFTGMLYCLHADNGIILCGREISQTLLTMAMFIIHVQVHWFTTI